MGPHDRDRVPLGSRQEDAGAERRLTVCRPLKPYWDCWPEMDRLIGKLLDWAIKDIHTAPSPYCCRDEEKVGQ